MNYTIAAIVISLNALGFLVPFARAAKDMLFNPIPLLPVLAGGVGVAFWASKQKRSAWDVLEHEVTHGIWSEFTGHKVDQIVASDKSVGSQKTGVLSALGYCRSETTPTGFRAHCWILSPYCFPTLTVLLFLLRLTFEDSSSWAFDALIGGTLGYHLHSHWKQIPAAIRAAATDTEKVSDFARFGIPYSCAFLFMAQLLIVPSVLLTIHAGLPAAAQYLIDGHLFWANLLLY